MPTFLQVESGEVLGYISGAKLAASDTLIEATPEMLAELRALEDEIAARGQAARVRYERGRLALPADTRPYMSIVSDKSEIAADGEDVATVTVTMLTPDGKVVSDFNGAHIFSTQSGRQWRLEFVDGVAMKRFTTTKSGRFDIESSNDYRLREPFAIVAWE